IVAKFGQIVSVGSTAVGHLTYPNQTQTLTTGVNTVDALKQFGKDFGYTFAASPTVISPPQGHNQRTVLSGGGVTADSVTAELQYVATSNGLDLAWKMVVPTADHKHWYD